MKFLGTIFIHFDPVGTQWVVRVNCNIWTHTVAQMAHQLSLHLKIWNSKTNSKLPYSTRDDHA